MYYSLPVEHNHPSVSETESMNPLAVTVYQTSVYKSHLMEGALNYYT